MFLGRPGSFRTTFPKASVVNPLQQRAHGRLDGADQPEINGRAAANVFWTFVDLNLLRDMPGRNSADEIRAAHPDLAFGQGG